MARLGDVCTVVSGTTPKSARQEYWDGNLNWVTPAELTDESDIIYETQRKITLQAVIDSNLKSFPAGTVLLSSRAPIGKVAIAGVEMYCNQGFKNLICSDRIYNRYLYHFLKGKTDYLNSLGRGATFKEISKSIVEDIEIPLLPLEQQRKIAAVLDKVSDLIAKRRTQLDKLDELVKSRFIEMFGDVTKNEKNWSTRKISEIATLQSGGTPSRQCPKYFEGTIPWITTVALGKNAIGIEDAIEYITEEAIENSATKLIPKNSLLFGIRVGVGKVSENIVPMCINQDIVAIIINDRYKLNMLFLKNLLDMFSGYFNSQKRGATIQGIKSEVLKNISVSLPPIELQNQFADFVKQTDKSKLAIQKNLEKLEILRKSLMQKYFD